MRDLVVLAALMVSSSVFGQECIRPEWGKCVSFPNGGSHTGSSIQKEKIQAEVTPGPDICVVNEEESAAIRSRDSRAAAPRGRTRSGPRTSTISVSSRSEQVSQSTSSPGLTGRSGNPSNIVAYWVPAFAGTTDVRLTLSDEIRSMPGIRLSNGATI